jgi:outer membrane lipoprotein-sorting protein
MLLKQAIRWESKKMADNEKEFENFVRAIKFDDKPNLSHRDKLEQDLLDALTQQPRHRQPLKIWRTIMKSRTTKLATAAAIIIAVLVGIHHLGGSIDDASIAWADVLEEISNFRPYACTVTVQDEGTPARSKYLMQLSLTRRREVYSNGTIIVFDIAVPKILTLVPDKKHAIEKTLDMQPGKDFDLLRLVSSMQNKPSEEGGVQEIGVQKIEDRAAKGFRSLSKFNDITVWADVQTKLPVRVEIIHVGKGRKIINSEFKFDVDFDESLFSTTAPEGYTVEKVEKGGLTELQKFMRSTTEEDLIEGLRAVAVFLDGEFPPEIELRKLQTALKEYIKQNNLSESEVKERLKAVSEKWTKAHWYTKLLRGKMEVRNFRYAGEGVKLGDANTLVVWWLPKDSETYRVIYGDLSVKDVAPENLPK